MLKSDLLKEKQCFHCVRSKMKSALRSSLDHESIHCPKVVELQKVEVCQKLN